MKYIDNLLNGFTMYRIVLYGLIALVVCAFLFSFAGIMSYTPIELLISLMILLLVCYGSNTLFGRMLNAPVNTESYLITALILFFILKPATDIDKIIALAVAAIFAMASKYILAIDKKHIFNPAAVATFSLGLLGFGSAIWWVGTPSLLPIVMIIGFLVVRKIRRLQMFLTFLITALVSLSVTGMVNQLSVSETLQQAILSGPLLFFGTIMFTEPLTTPPTRKLQMIYAVLVGILFGAQFDFGFIYSTPALALLLGNIFSYIVSPKTRLFLSLQEQRALSTDMREFVFTSSQKLAYLPGQYLEWTLPHAKADSRGNRRYFTIASSPTENYLKLGVKIATNHQSSFKKHLAEMKPGEIMTAAQLSGDFTLPKDPSKKLLFIAGGIGITPFRSMIQYLLDRNEKRDIILLYTTPDPKEIAYQSIFEHAKAVGIKTIYVCTRPENAQIGWNGKLGRITDAMLLDVAPDYKDRIAYLSGPNAMVESYKKLLHSLGVYRNTIKSDYFPGF